MRDLVDLWLRLPGVEPASLDRLGVSFYAAQIVGGVRQGKCGLILPVYIDPPSIYRSVEKPALIDLVGFDPAQPSRWQTLRGDGVMLGEAAYQEAIFDGLELPVFRDPLRWLQHAGAGVFPLDVDRFVREIVGHPFLVLAGQGLELSEGLTNSLKASPRVDLPEVRVLV